MYLAEAQYELIGVGSIAEQNPTELVRDLEKVFGGNLIMDCKDL